MHTPPVVGGSAGAEPVADGVEPGLDGDGEAVPEQAARRTTRPAAASWT